MKANLIAIIALLFIIKSASAQNVTLKVTLVNSKSTSFNIWMPNALIIKNRSKCR